MRTVNHEAWTNDLIECAKSIIQNAESMVGTETYLTDVTVSIYLEAGSTPRINVDRNSVPDRIVEGE